MGSVLTEQQPLGSRTPASRGRHRRTHSGLARLAAGVFGEILLTAGALLGLFVVWQVWWTDVITADEQRSAVEAVEETYDTAAVPRSTQPRTDAPPSWTEEVSEGQPFATLHVPRWGPDYEVPVTEGVSLGVLNTGAAGHYPETGMPGQVGNFALAGHRQTYGAAFRHVDSLRIGDPLIVETAEAWLVYRVSENYIVSPDQVEVIAPTPRQPGVEPTERLITLTTCHPLWSVAQRWITHGTFEQWIPRSEGMPAELLGDN